MDNVISLGRLSDRNYGCRQRPRYLIFSQFSIGPILLPKCVCLRGSASDPTGGHPAPPAGKRWVSPLQRAPQNCGPQGPETPRSATGKNQSSCILPCRCENGCNTDTGLCINGTKCIPGKPLGVSWSGPACQTGKRSNLANVVAFKVRT